MVQKAGKMSRRKMREGLKAYAFMAPALVILILFTIIPIIGSLVLMFLITRFWDRRNLSVLEILYRHFMIVNSLFP